MSKYPALEGRFPQVAGVSFAFDPKKPPGQRVDPAFVRIGDEYLNLQQTYRLATKSYLHTGCDGYVMLKNAQIDVRRRTTAFLYCSNFVFCCCCIGNG